MDRQSPTRANRPTGPTHPTRTTAQDVTAAVVRRPRRAMAGVLAAAALGTAALAGCSSDSEPSKAVSSAAGAVQSGLSA
ncbi:hypothetical protein ACFVXQ_14225, partial [Kitasatospora sp. NPDC058263]